MTADDSVDFVVCLPMADGNAGGFDDNVYGVCSRCGRAIQWRPAAPAVAKVCRLCYEADLKGGALDNIDFAITDETVEEFLQWAQANGRREITRENVRAHMTEMMKQHLAAIARGER